MKDHPASSPLANSINDSCQRIGIGRSMLYQLIDFEEIKPFYVGTRTLIPESELQRFICRLWLVARVNKRLQAKPERHYVAMRAFKPSMRNCGRYFILDEKDNLVTADVDLIALARSLELSNPEEELARTELQRE